MSIPVEGVTTVLAFEEQNLIQKCIMSSFLIFNIIELDAKNANFSFSCCVNIGRMVSDWILKVFV